MTVRIATLPTARLELMAAAGREMAVAERALARQGCTVVARLLRDEGTFYEWDHYPAGDIYDRTHGAQYFYHAHAAHQRPSGEHGHFHTFVRPDGADKLYHLVAIAIDHRGQPARMFTVNRWATEETWADAGRVIGLLDRFVLDLPKPSRWVNRWLTALLRLFRPQIEVLLIQRDRAIEDWGRAHPGADSLAARELEVLSDMPITIAAQTDAIARALAQPRRNAR